MKKIILTIIFLAILIAGGLICYFLAQKPENQNQENPLIKADSPQSNETIQSPYTVKGEARGNWYFEASFPVKLLDENGNIIEQTFAQAKGDWMTENFVPFESVLVFSVAKDQNGTLVLAKDNPSGLPENDAEVRIPVFLKASRMISLYYYDSELDKDSSGNILCSRQGLTEVKRQIPITNTPIQDTIKLLISGDLTEAEKVQGLGTEYPLPEFSLETASLNNGVLTLTFKDPNNKTSGGSCRAGILWFQIEATAKQFDGVSQVRFMPEELFQP
jgi:spore germination protein GerM